MMRLTDADVDVVEEYEVNFRWRYVEVEVDVVVSEGCWGSNENRLNERTSF